MPVEMDVIEARCKELRKLMRERPTLPLCADGAALTTSDLDSGVKLPLYSCPFKKVKTVLAITIPMTEHPFYTTLQEVQETAHMPVRSAIFVRTTLPG